MSDNSTAAESIEGNFEPGAFDAVEIDFEVVAECVRNIFEGLSPAELNRLAWRPTEWSPGSIEKQIVLQLRISFEVNFKRPMGWGINHAADNTDEGTLPEPRSLNNLRKPDRRSQRLVDAPQFETTTEPDKWEIGDYG